MNTLSEHMKETADIIDGYMTGRLVVESGVVSLQRRDGSLMPLTAAQIVEVRNGSDYERISLEQALNAFTDEGWPLYSGLYARIK